MLKPSLTIAEDFSPYSLFEVYNTFLRYSNHNFSHTSRTDCILRKFESRMFAFTKLKTRNNNEHLDSHSHYRRRVKAMRFDLMF